VDGLVELRAVADTADRAVRRVAREGIAALGPVPVRLVVALPEGRMGLRLRLQRGPYLGGGVPRTSVLYLYALSLAQAVPLA
jgi:hypothetical protein